MTDVLTALGPHWDGRVAGTLEAARGVTVARRCADLPELLSVAQAGLGRCVIVSHDLRGLDLSVVGRLRAGRLHVVGVHPPGDEGAERRLRQLGIAAVLPVDASPERFAEAVAGGSPAPAGPHAAQDLPLVGAFEVPDDVSGVADGGWSPAGSAAGRPDDEGTLAPREPDEHRPGRGRLVAVWGPTGAPGRTTVAVTVAAELAARGMRVVLVDADTYGGCVGQTLGLLDEAPGLAAACRAADHGGLDLPTLAGLAPEVTAGLRVLTGIPKAERWTEIRAASLERVLWLARGLADVVVADVGFCLENDEELSYDTLAPRRNEATLTTLAAADAVLAVASADPVGLQRLVRGLQEIGTVPSPPPFPVVNRVRSSAVGPHPETRISESLLRFAGVEHVVYLPEDREAVDAALLMGRSVVEHAPECALRLAVARLVDAALPGVASPSVIRSRWRRRAFLSGIAGGRFSPLRG
ncbi:MAG TPA: hypothetical protein VFJ94_15900 [Intrasporangium sp.]|uniref:AAA family ATPase n=1 Tax=Intrasporangium sp. TaxID=1925024 RepID=UPI002D797503|nr:hypothetical protein [Intrasporangium sp.]HET7399999.1 hypothetical protein [Intrasporangium sp.]